VIREDRKTNRVKIKQCFVGNRVIQGDLAKLDEQEDKAGHRQKGHKRQKGKSNNFTNPGI
jgi:hypothetical protein